MSFVIDDLLDFAMLKNDKFRKEIKQFNLQEVIQEVIEILEEKANMLSIKLTCKFKPQTISG